MNSNFIDHIRIFCASGAGGNGSAHLRRALPPGLPTVFISSVTGSGINALKEELWKVLNESGHQQKHQ